MRPPALLRAAALAVVMLAGVPALADVSVDERRPGISELTVENATNTEVLKALAERFGFTPDIRDEVWGLERRSYRATGRVERLLEAALKGSSHLFGFSGSTTVPSAITVLPPASGEALLEPLPLAEAPDPDAAMTLPTSTVSASPAPTAAIAAEAHPVESVATLLEARALRPDAAARRGGAATDRVTPEALAELSRRTRAGVIGLAAALQKSDRTVVAQAR